MSKYRNTVLTALGIDLAKRANAGQAKFKVTKVATSADDLGDISTEQLERMTEVPNVAQYGTITDAEPLETDNSAIGVSLRFTNKGLSAGYKIRIVGLYVREDGQQNDILYAVTTATEPEYMPDFNDQVLYRFNMQMYVVVGRAQSVSVLVDDSTVVSVKNFTDYKTLNDKRVDKNISDIAQLREDFESNKETVKEDIKKAGQVKSVTMNSTKHDPDSSGNVNLGDALLPGLTAVTVGSDDIDIVYKSSKNRYTADITNALNNVINSAINSSRLTDEQKKGIGITYGDVSTSGSSYATVSKQATYSDTYHSFKLNNSGTVEALNQLDKRTNGILQRVADLTPDELPNNTDLNTVKDAKDYGLSGINVTNAPYTTSVWGVLSVYTTTPTNGLQVFTETNSGEVYTRIWHNTNVFTKWERLANTDDIKVSSVNGKTGDVNIDTVDTVSIVDGSNVTFSDFMGVGGDTSEPDMKLTQTSSKTNATTLVSKVAFEKVTQQLGQALKLFNSVTSTNYSGLSDDIANLKANYATKQWVTENFMPKPYITNNSSTADTYSKAHPDQLVILTK